ncbi:MAG: oligosaccharide flippase family protein [Cytophagales bacterium]|nr:oligosaccharide flippase family protein [Cytophagales bacterium]
MSALRKLASQAAIYGLSSILGRMLNYLLVPLYTSVFTSPEQYGLITELYAYAAFFNIIYTLGMETTYFRFASRQGQRQGEFIALPCLSVVGRVSVFFSLGFWIYSDQVASFMGYAGQGHLIRWMALILALDAVMALPFAKLRLQGRATRFAALRLTNIGLTIGLNLAFLLLVPWLGQRGGWAAFTAFYDPARQVEYVLLANLVASAVLPLLLRQRTWGG